MLDAMRRPFFIVALVALALAVLVEFGSIGVIAQHGTTAAASLDLPTTGRAIPALATLDTLLLFATVITGFGLLEQEWIQSKLQGIVTLIFAVLLLMAAIGYLIKDFILLVLMVSLLMAPIFGTIAYFAIWSSFGTDTARELLALAMLLKLIFAVCLVISHQGFIKEKGYMLVIATSFLSNLLIGFLFGLVPGFLASIADVIAALIILILAIVWGLVYGIGGLISVITVAKNVVTEG